MISHRQWTSLVMILTSFLGATMFSITMPSMALYLQDVVSNQSLGDDLVVSAEDYLGWLVAAYSIGQLVASPLSGLLFNHFHSARPVMLISLLLIIIGNLLYALSLTPMHLIWSRVLIGLGAGNATVCRAYLNKSCSGVEIGRWMAWLSASQAGGFVVGPLLGGVFGVLEEGVVLVDGTFKIVLDKNTAPAYLSVVLMLVNVLPFLIKYREFDIRDVAADECEPLLSNADPSSSSSSIDLGSSKNNLYSTINNDKNATKNTESTINDENTTTTNVDYDHLALHLTTLQFFLTVLTFSTFETILVPFTRVNYGWDVGQNGWLFGGSSAVTVLVLVGMGIVRGRLGRQRREKNEKERIEDFEDCKSDHCDDYEYDDTEDTATTACLKDHQPQAPLIPKHPAPNPNPVLEDHLGSLLEQDRFYIVLGLVLLLFSMLFVSYSPFHYQAPGWTPDALVGPAATIPAASSIGVLDQKSLPMIMNTGVEQNTRLQIPVGQFLFSALGLFSPGFPVAQASCFILFSKILGPGEHGVQMGLQTAFGSLARIVGPLIGTWIWKMEPEWLYDSRHGGDPFWRSRNTTNTTTTVNIDTATTKSMTTAIPEMYPYLSIMSVGGPNKKDDNQLPTGFRTGIYLWVTTALLTLLGVITMAIGWRRMVPYEVYAGRRSVVNHNS